MSENIVSRVSEPRARVRRNIPSHSQSDRYLLASPRTIAGSILAHGHSKHEVVMAATRQMLDAKHDADGVTHFRFSDDTFLVAHAWGASFLAVDPHSEESWDEYVAWMTDHDALQYVYVGVVGRGGNVMRDTPFESSPSTMLN